MDKDKIKGTVDDAAGRAKRQVGEWTDDTKAQVEGVTQQVKGKAETAWGNVKDAVRNAGNRSGPDRDARVERDTADTDRNSDDLDRP